MAARELETNRELGAVFGRIRTEAAPRVLVGPFLRLRQLALRVELLAGAVAAIRHAACKQARSVLLVEVEALRLAVGGGGAALVPSLVPVQPPPITGVIDHQLVFGGNSLP